MAASLNRARDSMRTILGDRYAAKMKELGGYIERVAKARNVSILSAGIDLARNREGMDSVVILAAVVELVEPTPGVPA